MLGLDAGCRHNHPVCAWRIGHLIGTLRDKAEAAGITVALADERGTSPTCPAWARRDIPVLPACHGNFSLCHPERQQNPGPCDIL